MKFAREGIVATAVPAVAALVLGPMLGEAVFIGLALVALAVLLFFRDPERVIPSDPSALVSPADGRVIAVEENGKPHRFAAETTTRISIFMSPLDVHINRIPTAGTVEQIEHKPGRFAAAYRADASEINESNSLLLRTPGGVPIVVVQIAGWLARRIICHVRPQARVSRGERFGLIMFGSRLDVFLPPQVRPAVRVGDRVRAGASVIALAAVEGGGDESRKA
ncbi:MAG: phosphatidylserine decarboxylase family protein [Deltaproteobacteria bacterium]|nr:phosphatidylserine decarboxylase family protein [Deltaproteobacteria bacterium]